MSNPDHATRELTERDVSRPARSPRNPVVWVQTDRRTHEAWAILIRKHPTAASLAHLLVACMDDGTNSLVVAQSTLAAMMQCSVDTVARALAVLEKGCWVQRVRLGKGREAAYVVNSRVAWTLSRKKLHMARFTATVVAAATAEEAAAQAAAPPLRKLAVLRRPGDRAGTRQMPAGAGLEPVSQPGLDGVAPPDLPMSDDLADWMLPPGLNLPPPE